MPSVHSNRELSIAGGTGTHSFQPLTPASACHVDRRVHSVNLTRDEQAPAARCANLKVQNYPAFVEALMQSVKGSLASGFDRPQLASGMVRALFDPEHVNRTLLTSTGANLLVNQMVYYRPARTNNLTSRSFPGDAVEVMECLNLTELLARDK